MSKDQYKEYFEQSNFKGNNYETAKFIKFLMGKKSRGKEIEELTGIKHSQITSYKKIINLGKIEELKNASTNKVFKSIGATKKCPKKIDEIISGIECLKLDDISDSEDEEESFEEHFQRLVAEGSNELTEELELWVADLESEVAELRILGSYPQAVL